MNLLRKNLSKGIYAIRSIKQACGLDTAKVTYFASFGSNLRYRIATLEGKASGNIERVLFQEKISISF